MRMDDDIRPNGRAYGLIIRLAGWPAPGTSTVVLAANHAPGIGTLASIVTEDSELTRLLHEAGFENYDDLPNTLEIVIGFRLDRHEQVTGHYLHDAFPRS